MIDVSLCGDPWVSKGVGAPYKKIVEWLNTLPAIAANLDASGGKLKAALTSSAPLYVTCNRYTIGSEAILYVNVKVDDQHYRVLIGYDDKAIRVETLNALAAQAQTQKDAIAAGVLEPSSPGPLAERSAPKDKFQSVY